jgi:hypothetical protein
MRRNSIDDLTFRIDAHAAPEIPRNTPVLAPRTDDVLRDGAVARWCCVAPGPFAS